MNYKTIQDHEHAILLQQLTLADVSTSEKDELEKLIKDLYSQYHHLLIQLKDVLNKYAQAQRKVKRRLPRHILEQIN